MNDKHKKAHGAYEHLLKSYYGGHQHRHLRVPPGSRPLPKTADAVLANYYGKPLPLAHHQHHHHGQHGHHDHHGHNGRRHRHELTMSLDDGEVLAIAPDAGFEEYVVSKSMAEDYSDEYVVERIPFQIELSASSSLLDALPDPQQEFNVDILSPLSPLQAMPAPNASPNPMPIPAPAMPASPAQAAASMSTPRQAQRDAQPSTATEDDFMADMQSILSGVGVFDPVSKKTVPKDELRRADQAPQQAEPQRNNSQDIFDKIAQSMQFANSYDLGTVELENRFANFDRDLDKQQLDSKSKRSKKSEPAAPPSGVAPTPPASTEDFLHDMAAVAQSVPDRSSPAYVDDVEFSMEAGAVKDLQGAFVTTSLQTLFGNAAGIDQYFSGHGATGFIDWFNSNLANRGTWAGKSIGSGAQANFQAIWDRIPEIFGSSQINLLQFVSLMSIFINEVGGTLGPISEKVGMKGHPGLAYAFDNIPEIPKTSYNDGGSNWTAYQCFRDPDFIDAHGRKALGDTLRNTDDARWSGHAYPDGVATDVNPAITGFVMEADFYKFRGRGMIQTTWRAAYKRLIDFVQSYSGTQAEIVSRKQAWAGMSLDKAANISANADWDALFMKTDLEIPCVAIAQHSSQSGNYLNLSGDVNVLNGQASGSIWGMGKRISGGTKYANLFRSRVIAVCNLLGNAEA